MLRSVGVCSFSKASVVLTMMLKRFVAGDSSSSTAPSLLSASLFADGAFRSFADQLHSAVLSSVIAGQLPQTDGMSCLFCVIMYRCALNAALLLCLFCCCPNSATAGVFETFRNGNSLRQTRFASTTAAYRVRNLANIVFCSSP